MSVLMPAGITAFNYAQASTLKEVLTKMCPQVLAVHVETEGTSARSAAVSGMLGAVNKRGDIPETSASVTRLSGRDDFAYGDPEVYRPKYELVLSRKDVADESTGLSADVEARCRAQLGHRVTYVPQDFVRAIPIAYMRSEAAFPSDNNSETLFSYDLQHNFILYAKWAMGTDYVRFAYYDFHDKPRGWQFPEDSNSDGVVDDLKASGNLITPVRKLGTGVRPTNMLTLKMTNPNKYRYSDNFDAEQYVAAIKPRCYDPDDSSDDDGFGWVVDPELEPGGSGNGVIGEVVDHHGLTRIAIPGPDLNGKYAGSIVDLIPEGDDGSIATRADSIITAFSNGNNGVAVTRRGLIGITEGTWRYATHRSTSGDAYETTLSAPLGAGGSRIDVDLPVLTYWMMEMKITCRVRSIVRTSERIVD